MSVFVLKLTPPLNKADLTGLLGGTTAIEYSTFTHTEASKRLGPGEVRFGRWDMNPGASDMPSLVVTNQGEGRDFLAWISTFFPSLAPFTQWCRVVDSEIMSQEAHCQRMMPILHAQVWSSIVLGECFAQLREPIDLEDVPLIAALNCETFVFARSQAVWGNALSSSDIARRWSDFLRGSGQTNKRVPRHHITAVWAIVADFLNGREQNSGNKSIILKALNELVSRGQVDPASWDQLAKYVGTNRPLPDMASSQQERLRAFDALARDMRIFDDPVADFVAGYVASLVGGGRLAHMELLHPYLERVPGSPLWFSVCATLAGKTATGAEFGGFGRQVAKELLSPFELAFPPRGDIALSELQMMLDEGPARQLNVRSLSRNFLLVEVVPGVVAAWSSMSGREHNSKREAPKVDALPSVSRHKVGEDSMHVIGDMRRALDRLENTLRADLTRAIEPPLQQKKYVDQDESLSLPKTRSRQRNQKGAPKDDTLV